MRKKNEETNKKYDIFAIDHLGLKLSYDDVSLP
jgi:hypothetical protein